MTDSNPEYINKVNLLHDASDKVITVTFRNTLINVHWYTTVQFTHFGSIRILEHWPEHIQYEGSDTAKKAVTTVRCVLREDLVRTVNAVLIDGKQYPVFNPRHIFSYRRRDKYGREQPLNPHRIINNED